MDIRIIINSWVPDPGQESDGMMHQKGHMERSEVWRGDLKIERDGMYITKISIMAAGEPQPICDIPFSLSEGHYMWVPATIEREDDTEYELEIPLDS